MASFTRTGDAGHGSRGGALERLPLHRAALVPGGKNPRRCAGCARTPLAHSRRCRQTCLTLYKTRPHRTRIFSERGAVFFAYLPI